MEPPFKLSPSFREGPVKQEGQRSVVVQIRTSGVDGDTRRRYRFGFIRSSKGLKRYGEVIVGTDLLWAETQCCSVAPFGFRRFIHCCVGVPKSIPGIRITRLKFENVAEGLCRGPQVSLIFQRTRKIVVCIDKIGRTAHRFPEQGDGIRNVAAINSPHAKREKRLGLGRPFGSRTGCGNSSWISSCLHDRSPMLSGCHPPPEAPLPIHLPASAAPGASWGTTCSKNLQEATANRVRTAQA
jgi:hypothetical protein